MSSFSQLFSRFLKKIHTLSGGYEKIIVCDIAFGVYNTVYLKSVQYYASKVMFCVTHVVFQVALPNSCKCLVRKTLGSSCM